MYSYKIDEKLSEFSKREHINQLDVARTKLIALNLFAVSWLE